MGVTYWLLEYNWTTHQLVFCKRDNNCAWGHCAATAFIEAATGGKVYGTIWELANEDMVSLDKQEGVPELYQPFTVDVNLLSSTDPVKTEKSFSCRTYAMGTEEYGAAVAPVPITTAHNPDTPTKDNLRTNNVSNVGSIYTCPHCDRTFTSHAAWSVPCESLVQRLANQCLEHQHTPDAVASTTLTSLPHSPTAWAC
ncbi:hypothetical protein SprV_0501764500 [Sparganum proliferum]